MRALIVNGEPGNKLSWAAPAMAHKGRTSDTSRYASSDPPVQTPCGQRVYNPRTHSVRVRYGENGKGGDDKIDIRSLVRTSEREGRRAATTAHARHKLVYYGRQRRSTAGRGKEIEKTQGGEKGGRKEKRRSPSFFLEMEEKYIYCSKGSDRSARAHATAHVSLRSSAAQTNRPPSVVLG